MYTPCSCGTCVIIVCITSGLYINPHTCVHVHIRMYVVYVCACGNIAVVHNCSLLANQACDTHSSVHVRTHDKQIHINAYITFLKNYHTEEASLACRTALVAVEMHILPGTTP